jgi:hypothetical protein
MKKFVTKGKGGPFGTKHRWTCHHVVRVDFQEQKIPVDLSSRAEGRPFGTKKFRWTCHHMMRADVLEQKIPVDLSSRDEGGSSGTKNSGGPVIT